MAWSSLTNNQMVSYIDASTSGFSLLSGQTHFTTLPAANQCMTKSDALSKYDLDSTYMNDYTSNQLVPKSTWQSRPFVFDTDYIVLEYQFLDGRDLDTRTRIVLPNIGQTTQSTYVGWGVQSNWPTSGVPIIRWGGDNTGTGFESVMINLIRFRELYPSETSITVDLRAFWFGQLGTQPVTLRGTLYKGGTITGPSNFTFGNTGFIDSRVVTSASNTVSLLSTSSASSGQRVATLTYNLVTSTGAFNTSDTTTPVV